MKQETASRILIFVATAVLSASFGVVMDGLLLQQRASEFGILCASNVLIGTLAGSLVLQYKLRQKAKHQILEERIRTLSEVNQHIRGVLTSLVLYGTKNGDASAEALSELLRRVEENLDHLFTRLLFDQSLPHSVLKAAKDTVYSISR